LSVFTVRRIVDGYASKDGKTSILLNYMNGQDYPLTRLPKRVQDRLEEIEPGASKKNLVEMTREERDVVFEDAKNHSLGVLYHLQNFVHERADDQTNSFRNFRLSDEFGTGDSLPPKPYIRESLRMKAMYMMREQDGRNRDGETKTSAEERFSHVMYPDGLFAWQFHYDFHRTGRTYLEDEGDEGPWIDYETPGRHTRHVSDRCVFPARSLVPIRMNGLLGAQGNVGFSSIVGAAIRLHDQRIHIGQASGAMAAVSLLGKAQPREIVYDRTLLEEVRHGLCGGTDGVPLLLFPWRDLKPEDPSFVAVNRLSALGLMPVSSRAVDFSAAAELERGEEILLSENYIVNEMVKALAETENHGEYAKQLWRNVGQGKFPSFTLKSESDADGDGILDVDDALLFTPNEPIIWEIEKLPLRPESDGLISEKAKADSKCFDFGGKSVPNAVGFTRDSGAAFSSEKGFGWQRDISGNARHRNQLPEAERDAFLFTRTQDTWEVDAANGRYLVTVCVGDSGHEQKSQNVRLEGEQVIRDLATVAGKFHEASAEVVVSDGRLTVTIGKESGGSNTALSWIALKQVDRS